MPAPLPQTSGGSVPREAFQNVRYHDCPVPLFVAPKIWAWSMLWPGGAGGRNVARHHTVYARSRVRLTGSAVRNPLPPFQYPAPGSVSPGGKNAAAVWPGNMVPVPLNDGQG